MRDDRSPLYGTHRRQDRCRIHRPARQVLLLLAQPAGLHGHVPHFARRERFSVFQNLLELENDRRQADSRLANIPAAENCARRWPTSSCATRNSPRRCRSRWPSGFTSRRQERADFRAVTLAQTAKVSSIPRRAALYLVHGDLRRQCQPAPGLHGDVWRIPLKA